MTESGARYGLCGHPVIGRGLTGEDGSLWCYECGREEQESELIDFVTSTARYVKVVGTVLPTNDDSNALVDRLLVSSRPSPIPSRPLTRRKNLG